MLWQNHIILRNSYCNDTYLQVMEHGLGHLPFTEKQVITPTCTIFTVGIVVMMAMAKKSFYLSMIFLGFRVYG